DLGAPSERRGIAAHIGDAWDRRASQLANLLLGTGARRIQNDRIKTLQLIAVERPPVEVAVLHRSGRKRALQRRGGIARRFGGVAGARGERECPKSGKQVRDVACTCSSLPNRLDKRLFALLSCL